MGRTISVLAPLLLAGLFASSPVAAESDKHVTLEPTSPWQVHFADETCRLARRFSDGDDAYMLFFDQTGPGRIFTLGVAGPAFRKFRALDRIKVQFGDDKPHRGRPIGGSSEGFGRALVLSGMTFNPVTEGESEDRENTRRGLSLISQERAAQIDHIRVLYPSRSVDFAVGGLGKAVGVLTQCTQQFVALWGLDPDRHATMTRGARPIDVEAAANRARDYFPS